MINRLTTFQTIINNIFQDFIAKSIMIVYLNNILMTLEEHYKIVCRVLEVLAEHKLFLHPKEYKFNKLCIK